MVPQQNAAFSVQTTHRLNARVTRGLHTMSLEKSVPEGLNPQECKRTKLHEPPPVPYIPEKDKVQEEVVNFTKTPNQDFT